MVAAAVYADQKPTVAVLDFESIGSEEHLGKAVSEIMRTELIGTHQFRVVERAQINKAISEQKLQKSGMIDDRSAVELGKFLGADWIIIGSVVKIGTAYTINSRMIDTKTGEARLGKNVTGNDLNLLTTLSRNLIDHLFGTTRGNGQDAGVTTGTKELRILKAVYGAGDVQMDVTDILRQRIVNNQVAIPVSNASFGRDPRIGAWKAAGVRYETPQGEFDAYALEGQNLLIPTPLDLPIATRSISLKILQASYGTGQHQVDVQSIVQDRIVNGSVVVRASNVYFGVDPEVDVPKHCFIKYQTEKGVFETSIPEYQAAAIPDLRHKQLVSEKY